ncbi:MAG: hypothetical protein WC373_00785 [Smithella sp.]|jgi:hypothetical protein
MTSNEKIYELILSYNGIVNDESLVERIRQIIYEQVFWEGQKKEINLSTKEHPCEYAISTHDIRELILHPET